MLKPKSVVFWAALTSGGLFIFSCFWRGWDWYISETHASIIQSSILNSEIPYFSFFWNQGSYLLQDLQSPFFSLLTPLLFVFPSAMALRLVIGIVAFSGFLGCFNFLKKYFSESASIVGATAWCLNLWVLTRLASGNDMFIYGLLLPWVLVAIENIKTKKSLISVLQLSVIITLLLMAPAMHALIYLVFPVAALWTLILLFQTKEKKCFDLLKWFGLLLLALFIACLTCLPRVVAILQLPAFRNIPADYDLKWGGLLAGIFLPVYAGHRPLNWWGQYGADTSQISVLFPIQVLLIYRFKSIFRINRTMLLLVLGSVVLALALTNSMPLVNWINAHTNLAFRVLWRFLMLVSVASAVLAAKSWDDLPSQYSKFISQFLWVHLLFIPLSFAPYYFYLNATNHEMAQFLRPSWQSQIWSEKKSHSLLMKGIRSTSVFSDVTSVWSRYNPESISEGYGLIGLPQSAGNSCYNEVMYGHACLAYADRMYKRIGPPLSQTSICKGDCDFIQVTHQSIKILSQKTSGSVDLLLKIPELGFSPLDPGTEVNWEPLDPDSFRLKWKFSDPTAPQVILKVNPLVSPRVWKIWIAWLFLFFILWIVAKKKKVF